MTPLVGNHLIVDRAVAINSNFTEQAHDNSICKIRAEEIAVRKSQGKRSDSKWNGGRSAHGRRRFRISRGGYIGDDSAHCSCQLSVLHLYVEITGTAVDEGNLACYIGWVGKCCTAINWN